VGHGQILGIIIHHKNQLNGKSKIGSGSKFGCAFIKSKGGGQSKKEPNEPFRVDQEFPSELH